MKSLPIPTPLMVTVKFSTVFGKSRWDDIIRVQCLLTHSTPLQPELSSLVAHLTQVRMSSYLVYLPS